MSYRTSPISINCMGQMENIVILRTNKLTKRLIALFLCQGEEINEDGFVIYLRV